MEYYLNENFLIPPDSEIKKRLIKAITNSDIEMELIIDKKSIDRNTFNKLREYLTGHIMFNPLNDGQPEISLDIRTKFSSTDKLGKEYVTSSFERVTIHGRSNIQRYCNTNSINKIYELEFMKKQGVVDLESKLKKREYIKPWPSREQVTQGTAPYFRFRIQLKSELSLSKGQKNAFIKRINSDDKYYRYKCRWSFVTNDSQFRIDITAVKSTKDNMFYSSFKESKILDRPENYEVEIEYIGNKHKGFNLSDMKDLDFDTKVEEDSVEKEIQDKLKQKLLEYDTPFYYNKADPFSEKIAQFLIKHNRPVVEKHDAQVPDDPTQELPSSDKPYAPSATLSGFNTFGFKLPTFSKSDEEEEDLTYEQSRDKSEEYKKTMETLVEEKEELLKSGTLSRKDKSRLKEIELELDELIKKNYSVAPKPSTPEEAPPEEDGDAPKPTTPEDAPPEEVPRPVSPRSSPPEEVRKYDEESIKEMNNTLKKLQSEKGKISSDIKWDKKVDLPDSPTDYYLEPETDKDGVIDYKIETTQEYIARLYEVVETVKGDEKKKLQKFLKQVSLHQKYIDSMGEKENRLIEIENEEKELIVRIMKLTQSFTLIESSNALLNTYIALNRILNILLKKIYNTNFIISEKERKEIYEKYRQVTGQTGFRTRFIGPQPVSMSIENLITSKGLKKEHPNIHDTDYLVTEKADGERYLLFIHSNGYGYLFHNRHRTNEIINTGVKFPSKYHYWIMDGEYITQLKNQVSVKKFFIFDIYYASKEKTIGDSLSLTKALSGTPQGEMDIIEVFKQRWIPTKTSPGRSHYINDFMKYINSEVTFNPLQIEISKKHYINVIGNSFKAAKFKLDKINSTSKESMFQYETDGLIFMPMKFPVNSMEENIYKNHKLGGAWMANLKWKPSQLNTIDFAVNIKSEKRNMISPDNPQELVQYKDVHLLVSYNEKEDSTLDYFNILINDPLKQPRRSSRNIVFEIEKGDNIGITKLIMKNKKLYCTLDGEEIKGDTIVEFAFNESQPAGFQWIPLRLRRDKESPQFILTAKNIWKTIKEPISEEMVTTKPNEEDMKELQDKHITEDGGDNKYYKTIKRDISALKPYYDFHNMVKKNLIVAVCNLAYSETNIMKYGNQRQDIGVIDFAVGRGGDLIKFTQHDAHINRILGFDIDEGGIQECNGRWWNYSSKQRRRILGMFMVGDTSLNIKNGLISNNNYKILQILKDIMISNKSFGVCSDLYSGFATEDIKTLYDDDPTSRTYRRDIRSDDTNSKYDEYGAVKRLEKLWGTDEDAPIRKEIKDDIKENLKLNETFKEKSQFIEKYTGVKEPDIGDKKGKLYDEEKGKEELKEFAKDYISLETEERKNMMKSAPGFEVANIQFAIHYFFESPNKLDGLLRNVNENLKDKGYFIGTCYDGERVMRLLAEDSIVSAVEENTTLISVKKKYDISNEDFKWDGDKANEPAMYHQSIEVYHETFGSAQTEYLVNFDYLVDKCKEYNLYPITGKSVDNENYNYFLTQSMGNFNDYYEKYMNDPKTPNAIDDQFKQFSFLNRWFIFQKRDNPEE